MTEKEIKFIESEGYSFLGSEKKVIGNKRKRVVEFLKLKHPLCEREFEMRKSKFFSENQRCTCQRKRNFSSIQTREDYKQFLNNLNLNYSLESEFISKKKPVTIRCNECGERMYFSRADQPLQCRNCNLRAKNKSRRFFEKKLEDYENIFLEKFNPRNKKEYLKIRFRDCGHEQYLSQSEFYNKVIRKKKLKNRLHCKQCGPFSKQITIDRVKKEIKDADFEYEVLSDNYDSTHDHLLMKHKKCGRKFWSSRNNFLILGRRCPFCNQEKQESRGEQELKEFISQYFKTEKIKATKNGSKYELDVYIPELKIGFEFNGLYWHSDNILPDNYHIEKSNYFHEKGIQVIHIFEDEWDTKREIVKDKILNILKKNSKKIYARECTIKEISKEENKDFFDKNHIQGSLPFNIGIGLYYENELVAAMTFLKLRKALGQIAKKNFYELGRFAGKLGYNITGGFSRLLKYAIRNYDIEDITTYADLRFTNRDSNVYGKNGFSLSHISKPSYYYIKNKKREYRFKYRKSELERLFPEYYSKDKTEKEIMREAGFNRIYDCGNLVFRKKIRKGRK